jgi:hypothetical protein
MNPNVVRDKQSRGKNIKTIIQYTHILYKEFNEDIFDYETGMRILEDSQELETVQTILKTNDPINKIYIGESEAVFRSNQCKSAAEKIKRYVKALRQRSTRTKNKESEEFFKEAYEVLKSLSKRALIKQLIKRLPKAEIRRLVAQTQAKIDRKTKKSMETEQ